VRRTAHAGALAVAALSGALALAAAPPLDADTLVAQVVESQRTRGARIRARLAITPPRATRAKTLQLLIETRREGASREALYLVLFPAAEKGRALVIRRTADGAATGFLREPDGSITPLTEQRMGDPVLGSALTVEDLAESFMDWPSPRLAGRDAVASRSCEVVEFRRPRAGAGRSAVVRACLSPELRLPLRVESFDAGGALLKRIEADRLVRHDGRYTVAGFTVDSASGGRIELDGSKAERDVEIPADDFTPEGIARRLRD